MNDGVLDPIEADFTQLSTVAVLTPLEEGRLEYAADQIEGPPDEFE